MLRRKANVKKRGGLQRLAKQYLIELESHSLEVVLIPSKDHDCAMRGGMIRAVQEQNAEWYRTFCGEHGSNRKDRLRWVKFKTKIKRQNTKRALKELIDGRCATFYAKDLRAFILKYEAEQKARRAEDRKRRAA